MNVPDKWRVWSGVALGIFASAAVASDFETIRAEVVPVEIASSLTIAPRAVRIYVPDGEEWLAEGPWLKRELARKGCTNIEVVPAAGAVDSSGLALAPPLLTGTGPTGDCAILLGHMGNNALIRWLYLHWRTSLDADWLGDGGWALQAVPRAWGGNGHAVVLHGMDPGATRQAAARLLELLTEREDGAPEKVGHTWKLPVTFEFHPAASKSGAIQRVTRQIDDLEKRFNSLFDRKSPEFQGMQGRKNINVYMTGSMQYLGTIGLWWSVTADPRCPELAKRILSKVQESLTEFKGDPREMHALDYSLEQMARGMHLILAHPAFSAKDRLLILGLMSLFAEVTLPDQVAKEQSSENTARGRPAISSRHTNAMAAGAWHLARMLGHWAEIKGHTGETVAALRRSGERYLDALSESYSCYFDHIWTLDSVSLIQQYAVEKPKPEFLARSQLRLGADFVAMLMRPSGDLAVWGGESISPDERFWAWPCMGRAETMLGGGEYQWLHDRHLGPGSKAKTFIYNDPSGIHVYNPGHATREPMRLAGLCVAPTNPLIDEDVSDGVTPLWNGLSPKEPPAERRFHKLSYRSDWSTRAQYFLLSGLGGYHYGPSGMAGFLSYDHFGTQWICSLEPRYSERYQNTVFINRGRLKGRFVPFEASLESLDESEDGGYARLRLDHSNGANWTRHLFWEKDRHLLVWDELEATLEDDFFLACGWRSPVQEARLDASARALVATQSNLTFRIVHADMAGQVPCRMVLGNENPDPFPYRADFRITTLKEQVRVHLAPGEKYSFVNLLVAMEDPAAPSPRVRSLDNRTVRVELADGPRDYALADTNGWVQASNARARAAALEAQPGGWKAHDLTELVVPSVGAKPVVRADAAIHLHRGSNRVEATSATWKLDPVRVVSQGRAVVGGGWTDRVALGGTSAMVKRKALVAGLRFAPSGAGPLPVAIGANLPVFGGWKIGATLGRFPNAANGVTTIDQVAVGWANGRGVIALGLRDKLLKVMDDRGQELWKKPMVERISALLWMKPDHVRKEPLLVVGLATSGDQKNVQAFTLDGKLKWENDLGEPVYGYSYHKPYCLGQFDADGDGSDEVVAGEWVRDLLFDSRTGERKAAKHTVMFQSVKYLPLALASPTPSWMVTACYSGPPLCAYTLAGESRMMNFGRAKECTMTHELIQVGKPVDGVFQVAAAHGPYLSVGKFDTRKGEWLAESSWQQHLGADVHGLCAVPDGKGGTELMCAGDFGFLDRYTARGRRVARLPFEWTVHRLVRLKDGNILAGTEEGGLLVLGTDGQVLGRVEGDSGAAVREVLTWPGPAAGDDCLVVRRDGTLEMMTASGKKVELPAVPALGQPPPG